VPVGGGEGKILNLPVGNGWSVRVARLSPAYSSPNPPLLLVSAERTVVTLFGSLHTTASGHQTDRIPSFRRLRAARANELPFDFMHWASLFPRLVDDETFPLTTTTQATRCAFSFPSQQAGWRPSQSPARRSLKQTQRGSVDLARKTPRKRNGPISPERRAVRIYQKQQLFLLFSSRPSLDEP